MATGPIETHLHRSFNWENGAPGPREGQRGRSARCGNGLFAQCVRLRSEINRAITQPFAEMVWVTTGGDMETVNRLTDVLVTMNTPADRGKLFKIIKMLYGLMGLPFSEEAEPMDADLAVLEYFIFSFTADFGEVIQDLIAEEAE